MTKSQIFLFFCLSFILGIFIQSLLNIPQLFWLGILILGVIVAAIFWGRNKKAVVAGFCLLILAGGAYRYFWISDIQNFVKQYNDRGKIILTGVISEEPDVRSDNVKYKIKIDNLDDALGEILVVAKKYPEYNYGDILEITGKLKTPQSGEDFDYQKYLAKDDIFSIVYYPEIKLIETGQGKWLMEKLLVVKNKFKNSLEQILSEPQAAFLGWLLLGEKRGLPQDLTDAFSRTGTTHIIALSGFNITIIAVAMMSFFNFFMVRRQISFWLSMMVIVGFVLMTGASASAVRAAVMGILVLLAQQVGRLYQIRNALVLAGAIMVYLNPKVLVWDLGFQLSFAATLGLIYIMPIFQRWFYPTAELVDKSWFGWRGILSATLAAQIAVLPLLVINFGQLSLIAPLANLLILPVIPLTMFFGFIATTAGIIWLAAGKFFGWLAWLFLTYEIKVVEFLAKIPLAAVKIKWNWIEGVIYYAVLIWLIWWFGPTPYKIWGFNKRNKNVSADKK